MQPLVARYVASSYLLAWGVSILLDVRWFGAAIAEDVVGLYRRHWWKF